MSVNSTVENITNGNRARFIDYINLCKPRVVMLMLLTSYVGMLLAVPSVHFLNASQVIASGVGIMLAAGAGGAINQLIDRHLDKIMARTKQRPLPSGNISDKQALAQAILMSFTSLLILAWKVNLTTMWLTAVTLLSYGFLYSAYLKKASPQNIVIGGLSGAMPPMLGWASANGHLLSAGWSLVLIIFAWTPPHFWALAIHRQDDYIKTNLPMLPITHGVRCAKIQIFLYTIFMSITTYIPCLVMHTGILYLLGVSVINVFFIYYVWKLLTSDNRRYAFAVFRYSITYLGLLFALLLIDHLR